MFRKFSKYLVDISHIMVGQYLISFGSVVFSLVILGNLELMGPAAVFLSLVILGNHELMGHAAVFFSLKIDANVPQEF